MLVLGALKRSIKPLPFLYLILIFSSAAFFLSIIFSINYSGQNLDAFNLFLNFINNPSFYKGYKELAEFLDLSSFNLKNFFHSTLNFLFLFTFLFTFIIFHLFLPLIYKKLNSEKGSILSYNSLYVLISGCFQLLLYSLLFYLYILLNSYLKPFFNSLLLETYKIVLEALKDFVFILFALFLRYFFAFTKVTLSFEKFSLLVLKNSLSLTFKNFLKLTLFHLILFGINYSLLQVFSGNFLNVLIKTYFFQLSLSYYLVLEENRKG